MKKICAFAPATIANVNVGFDVLGLSLSTIGDKVELKGSFCMERCGEGINWQIDDEFFTNKNVDDAVAIFREKILGNTK